MGNGLNSSRRWTPAQGYVIGASLRNLIRQGWTLTNATRLPGEGQAIFWDVALRRDSEVLNMVVSDGPVMHELAAGLSKSALDAA